MTYEIIPIWETYLFDDKKDKFAYTEHVQRFDTEEKALKIPNTNYVRKTEGIKINGEVFILAKSFENKAVEVL